MLVSSLLNSQYHQLVPSFLLQVPSSLSLHLFEIQLTRVESEYTLIFENKFDFHALRIHFNTRQEQFKSRHYVQMIRQVVGQCSLHYSVANVSSCHLTQPVVILDFHCFPSEHTKSSHSNTPTNYRKSRISHADQILVELSDAPTTSSP